MSLSPPRERTEGASEPNNNNNGDTNRNFQLYWCYQCHTAVRISSSANPSEIICPRCLGQFVHEIEVTRPRLFVDFTAFDPSPEARLLEALSIILEPPIRLFNRTPDDIQEEPSRGRSWFRRRSNNVNIEPEPTTFRPRTWIVFRPVGPSNPIEPIMRPTHPVPRGVSPRDYFFGPELNQLIEELTQNDRPGPPPVPEDAIDAIPTVKITETHLKNESNCPVCKEELMVDGEARELPCKHIYHSECIVPWLRLHNSCPVCRHEVPISSDSNIDTSGADDEISEDHEEEGLRRRCLRLRQLASLWPFRGRHRRINPQPDTGGNSQGQVMLNFQKLAQGRVIAIFYSPCMKLFLFLLEANCISTSYG
ncbi:hypothetical protein Patl1_08397 [Pistacia atlantica]|uniref:Uncharacterized protein n=1 Tax=Pistacia atlantica TaxID=434234 RepID=A0ACC1ACT7_9ROSI|nr:hypothetical protein Patl1_08397 [Pistacia atlantica]